jgi:hypothetical protein
VNKDFLCLTDWSREDLEKIFDLTRELKDKQKKGKKHRLLKGKTLGMIFEKSSTRTRVSFEGRHVSAGRPCPFSVLRQYPDGPWANRSRIRRESCPATWTAS